MEVMETQRIPASGRMPGPIGACRDGRRHGGHSPSIGSVRSVLRGGVDHPRNLSEGGGPLVERWAGVTAERQPSPIGNSDEDFLGWPAGPGHVVG